MKRILIALLIFTTCSSFAQNNNTDSLKQVLRTEIADTTRVMALFYLGNHYVFFSLDTSLIYTQQGLALSRQTGFIYGEANCLTNLGTIFWQAGNYPKSLEYYIQALKKYEIADDQFGLATSNGAIANIYAEMGDKQMEISYNSRCKTIAESLNDKLLLNYIYVNMGDFYEKQNQLDSALKYINQSYELAKLLNKTDSKGMALNNLGNIHSKMQHVEIAMDCYRQSLALGWEVKDFNLICETTLGVAALFKKTGQADSALYYARMSFATASDAGFTKRILNASTFLSTYFKNMNRFDSAYYYQSITIAAKDSLFSQEKSREVQNLSFTEKIRQQEIEEAARLAREERKSNIQLIGIVTFISFFFALLFVFSKRHVNPKVIKFLGLLGLLLLFEFISLFLHPYIAAFTHHTPVYMLLILVLIASLLVPMHHKLQRWVKEKLAQKTMNARTEYPDTLTTE